MTMGPRNLRLMTLAFIWLVALASASYGQYVYTNIESGSGTVWGYATVDSYESYDYVGIQGYLYDPNNNLINESWSQGWNSAEAEVEATVGTTGYYTIYGYGYGSYGDGDGWVYLGDDSEEAYAQAQTDCSVQNEMIQEYVSKGVLDTSSSGGGSAFVSECAWFTQTAHSYFYTFNQLGNIGNQPYSWALVKNPLTISQYATYGLDPWSVLLWNAGWGYTQTINSGYRPPVYNADVGGAKNSRHQFGDAIDIANVNRSQAEHDAKACWAGIAAATTYANLATPCSAMGISEDAGADWIEPTTLACGFGCVHADWRNHDYDVYSQ